MRSCDLHLPEVSVGSSTEVYACAVGSSALFRLPSLRASYGGIIRKMATKRDATSDAPYPCRQLYST